MLLMFNKQAAADLQGRWGEQNTRLPQTVKLLNEPSSLDHVIQVYSNDSSRI